MSLGERIEERMKALRLSQAELARRANVPQTTMNGLIRGKSRTTPHLIRIAQVLETTPAFLMGETDDPRAEFPASVLTREEQEWVNLLRRMKPIDRKTAIMSAKMRLEPELLDRIMNEDYWEQRQAERDEFNEIEYLQCVSEDLTEDEVIERLRQQAARSGQPVDEDMIRRIKARAKQ